MSKLSFRARALDASKPMPIYLAEELPDLPDYSAINRAVPQMPSGMEKEEESEHHLQRAISGTGLIIPTPEVCSVNDLEFYERCYPPDYKMPKQHIHMQPLWEEQEAPEYDIDTEDERWLKQQGHPELTELKFEQMMDKLEKCSGQTVVTLNEAKLLLERHDDLVIAVYDYWLNKRLNTQHPLILSVKTESRPGQSSNNPYLAFRRRTEKMQTRKNRKNDESSYEKMLKLRRDLARALTLLELVARRERAKRDLLKLTSLLAERRYVAKDFASQLLPDPPPRPQYTVPLVTASFRRETYPTPYYPPRPTVPVDQPRQREKRPYKRRKHRHHTGATLRESGVYTSSEEEGVPVEATAPDDGRYAFRRKPGCYYEMPTSTLNGDPVDPENLSGMYQHEIDVRHRYTLTSVNTPHRHCVGFARRRVGRGGRVLLDRVDTPHHDLYTSLHYSHPGSGVDRLQRQEEIDLETRAHRMPKELSRDYHTSGKYPWRYEFRKHLAKNPDVWLVPIKNDVEDLKIEVDVESDIKIDSDIKMDTSEVKIDAGEVKMDAGEVKMDTSEVKIEPSELLPDVVNKSDIRVSAMTIDGAVRGNLARVMRKRSWSGSDCSYDSDDSLLPVEQEFEKVYNEIKKKWLHFRPKTPPPSPPIPDTNDDQFPLAADTAISVELRTERPSAGLDLFTTSQFTLNDIYPEMADVDHSATSLDISGDDLITENLGLTEAQVESILSETDLKELTEVDDKKTLSEDFLTSLVKDEGFLCIGRSQASAGGSGPRRRRRGFGSSTVTVVAQDRETIYVDKIQEKIVPPPPKKPSPAAPRANPVPTPVQPVTTPIQPVTTPLQPVSTPIQPVSTPVQSVHVPTRSAPVVAVSDHVEEINVQLSHGVKIQTLHAKNSPVKKHIISTAPRDIATSRDLVTSRDTVTSAVPSVAQVQAPPVISQVPQALKVRLQNQIAVSQSGGVVNFVQNGPFAAVMPLPVHSREPGASTGVSARRPLVLAPRPLAPAHLHHMQPNKLKVLHAHPLTQTQRQLLTNRNIAQLPAVVSLATLGENKNTALLKAAPGSVTQFFEIKSGQLGKPHLVNVIRQPQPKTVARLDLIDKRKVVATFDGTLKGNLATSTRPHRVSVSLDGRQIVRAATLPSVRPQVRHQIQLKNRTLQVGPRSSTDPSTSITISAPTKTASIPSSVVANLLQKNVQIPKGQKIAISGPGGQALSANVQAIAFTTAQLKARQARLIAQPRPTPVAEIVEATTAPTTSSSTNLQQDTSHEATEDEASTNGVRRRPTDTLPMEVT